MASTIRSVALNAGLSLGGACLGEAIAERRVPRNHGLDYVHIVGAGLGAAALPTAYHLMKPVAQTLASGGGLQAAGRAFPASLTSAVLFGGASLAGAMVGGSITDDGSRRGGESFLAAIPGMVLGALLAAPTLAGAQKALGRCHGAAAFVACAAGVHGAAVIARAANK